jgi:hypothetical protein
VTAAIIASATVVAWLTLLILMDDRHITRHGRLLRHFTLATKHCNASLRRLNITMNHTKEAIRTSARATDCDTATRVRGSG